MPDSPNFDAGEAHRYFSAQCFNRAWDLIEKPDRSSEENEQMLLLSQAALWHWTQRADCSAKNLSIGYWQLSRVSVLLNDAGTALKYAERCLQVSPTDDPFLRGFAYEASARANFAAQDIEQANQQLAMAKEQAGKIEKSEDREMLKSDLRELESQLSRVNH